MRSVILVVGVPLPIATNRLRGRSRSFRDALCGTIPDMDRAQYEEVAGLLHDLLIRLDDRLPGKDATLIAEFIDAKELGLALEQMADVLSEDEQPLSSDERADMLALVGRMQLGDRVPRVLAFCPAR
jgi:hypothetical protein